MSIAVIIGTHGKAAEQLLRTAEMILGDQENVSWVDFVPGENAETLEKKYNELLKSLDTSKGGLFLVDMWGGSPFNAANRIVNEHKNFDIVTGVNIPMLIEIFMNRDDGHEIEELVSAAQEAGKVGIKAYHGKLQKTKKSSAPASAKEDKAPTDAIVKKETKEHLVIALARIDDRLIHGQVATRWTKETNVKRIVVVNDDVAKDEVRSTLLKQAAPPGVTAHVVGVDKMVRVYNNPKYAKERMMLLFTNPADILKLVDNGVDIKSINVGGMAYQRGKKQISDAISVDKNDITAFNQLNEKGITLEFRKVASDNYVNVMDLLKKV